MKSLKYAILFSAVAGVAVLAGCSKSQPVAEKKPAEATAEVEKENKEPEVRQATYDPNLKPAEIVWDSPEKKKRWEELQKKLQTQKQTEGQQ